MTSPLSSLYLQHLGGAISRGRPDEAAFGHRDAVFDFIILTVWEDLTETDTHLTWTRELFAATEPHATGVYVNNLGVEGSDRVKAAYAPDTYRRLVALKDSYETATATAEAETSKTSRKRRLRRPISERRKQAPDEPKRESPPLGLTGGETPGSCVRALS